MKIGRKALELAVKAVADEIRPRIASMFGPRVGFALFIFDFGTTGNLAYAANAERDGVVAMVKEWLAAVEAAKPPGGAS